MAVFPGVGSGTDCENYWNDDWVGVNIFPNIIADQYNEKA